jgi:hypothetical protein
VNHLGVVSDSALLRREIVEIGLNETEDLAGFYWGSERQGPGSKIDMSALPESGVFQK